MRLPERIFTEGGRRCRTPERHDLERYLKSQAILPHVWKKKMVRHGDWDVLQAEGLYKSTKGRKNIAALYPSMIIADLPQTSLVPDSLIPQPSIWLSTSTWNTFDDLISTALWSKEFQRIDSHCEKQFCLSVLNDQPVILKQCPLIQDCLWSENILTSTQSLNLYLYPIVKSPNLQCKRFFDQ